METNSSLSKEIKRFFKNTFDISQDTDKRNTINDIIAGIDMKGQNVWVLIFSILIASTGLNTSSTAVVIGAMLISPLMGPILGMGLSLGIYDIDLLKRSLKNFGVMVVTSLVTSFLFFSVPLFQNETPEIIARTSPNVLDIIIALSGGLALIVAFSRKNKSTTTIAGVAIATALMPPLCTAGYGLATGKWSFFGGAMFLFTINTIFIASATYLVVKFLNFPLKEYADLGRKTRISRILTFIALIIFIPSVYFFYQLYQKSRFEQGVESVLMNLKADKGIGVFDIYSDYVERTVSFAVIGGKLENTEIKKIQDKITQLGYEDVKVKVLQNLENEQTLSRLNEIENSYLTSQQLLLKKEEEIVQKNKEILDLKEQLRVVNEKEASAISFLALSEEIKSLNTEIKEVAYAPVLKTNFVTIDTVPNFTIKWNDEVKPTTQKTETQRFEKWLRTKLKNNKVIVQSE